MHKGRGKLLQSDSSGTKDWGIDRGTDEDRERFGVKSRAEDRGGKGGMKKKQQQKRKTETFYIACSTTHWS